MAKTITCPVCKRDLPDESRFCPHCGVARAPSETAEMFTRPPSSDAHELMHSQPASRRSLHEAYRQPLGAQPPAFLGGLALVALILGVILLITGPWISAVIALGVFIGLIVLFIPAIRHDPGSQVARTARRSVNSVTSSTRFAAVAGRAWAQAALSLLHTKQRRLRVKRELHSQLTPLGEAVHRGDQARVQQLKAQADKLEQQLQEIDSNASAIVETARETVEREKGSSQPTQALPATPTEIDIGEAERSSAPDDPQARPAPSAVQPPPRRRRAPLAP